VSSIVAGRGFGIVRAVLLGRAAGGEADRGSPRPGAGQGSATRAATKGDLGGPIPPPASRPRRRPPAHALTLLALTLLVAALTAALYNFADRYQPDGRAWLANPGLAYDAAGRLAGWEVEGPPGSIRVLAGGGGVRLTNLDPAGGVGLRQVLRRERGDAAVFDLSAPSAARASAGVGAAGGRGA
jgi:hypothetical protein